MTDRTSNHTWFGWWKTYSWRSGFCAPRSCWGTLYTAHTEQKDDGMDLLPVWERS